VGEELDFDLDFDLDLVGGVSLDSSQDRSLPVYGFHTYILSVFPILINKATI